MVLILNELLSVEEKRRKNCREWKEIFLQTEREREEKVRSMKKFEGITRRWMWKFVEGNVKIFGERMRRKQREKVRKNEVPFSRKKS